MVPTPWDATAGPWSTRTARWPRRLEPSERPHGEATQPGSAPVELKPGDANHLPYPDASFDVATATQVLEYGVTAQEAKAWADDLRSLGDGYFFSLNRYLFCATSRA